MDEVNERTTPVITVAFTDEDDEAVTPTAATYQIDDFGSGTEILAETEIESLDTSISLTLTQAQTRILDETHYYEIRRITVKFDYGSSKHGNKRYLLKVKNLSAVTTT